MSDFRSRSTLARNKLDDFRAFCESKGWLSEPVKGGFLGYEVLRMRHPDWKEPMIIHQRNNTESVHLTTWGNSADMLRRYLRAKRNKEWPSK